MYGGVHFSEDWPDASNCHQLDLNCLPMIRDMHRHGIRLDVPYINSLTVEINRQIADIEFEMGIHLGEYQDSYKGKRTPFSPGSPDHVSRLLFEHLKVQGSDPVPMTPKGKRFATSDDVLEIFKSRHPIIPLLGDWKEFATTRNTFTLPLPTLVDLDSRLHTTFNPTVAATGRLSSSNPNLQNIPVRSKLTVMVDGKPVPLGKAVRNAFIASPGCIFVSVDRSQDEMRWAAHGSQDPAMMEVFYLGQDIHWKNTCAIFGWDYDTVMSMDKKSPEFERIKREERAPTKNLGFGVLYGLTAPGLQRNILKESEGTIRWSEEKCQKFIDRFFGIYPALRTFMELQYTRAKRYGMVWDAFGRPRLVPEAKSTHMRLVNEGTRKAGNHYEQASSQGGVKLAMAETNVEMEKRNKSHRCTPALQIHDQILADVDKRYATEFGLYARNVMEGSVSLNVPSESSLEYAERWGDLQ